MIKSAYSAIVAGLSKYLVAILTGLLLAAGLATTVIYKNLDKARAEAAAAHEDARRYSGIAASRLNDLRAAEARHATERAALSARATAAEALNQKWKDHYDSLDKALGSNRSWADTPVPTGVLDALGKD